MMERDFYNEEFEELIRNKADQYKMYPSDSVWKEVYNSLHTRRRRFIAGMSILITGILFMAGKELLAPSNRMELVKKIADTGTITSATDTATPVLSELNIHSSSSPQAFQPENENKPVTDQPVTVAIPQQQLSAIPVIPLNTASISENADNLIENFTNESRAVVSGPIMQTSADGSWIGMKDISPEELVKKENSEDKKNINWLTEAAGFEMKNPVRRGRMNWQVYISPTGNYRTLSGGDPYPVQKTGVQYVPIALSHYGSPNDYVNHKPALGYEAGGNILYRLTRNLSIKVGLQFNYSRYNIKAYRSSNSQTATIALNSINGGYYNNTITAYSNIQNFGGNSLENLYNHYYQFSSPVGFELRILGNERLQLNIAATIQPTYLLNRNAYLLTTDYSDYTKEPSLFRRWNFNGGLEAFISYQVGGLRWQIGPQLRYQLYSTYVDQYPIKENLKEYGLKIGVSKTIW